MLRRPEAPESVSDGERRGPGDRVVAGPRACTRGAGAREASCCAPPCSARLPQARYTTPEPRQRPPALSPPTPGTPFRGVSSTTAASI